MSIIKTSLVDQFGNYYLNQGQNMESLREQLRQKAVTPSYAVPMLHDSDVFRYSDTFMGEIVQQFQKAFTAKGNVEFLPNEIRLRNAKIDISLYPDDVKASYLGFLQNMKDAERKNWPIVRYIIEKHVVPQIPHDMETKAYWGGSFVEPTPGTPGTTAGTIDGLKKQLDAGLLEADTRKRMNAVTLSAAPSATNAFEIMEEFADNISDLVSARPTTIYCDPKLVTQYLRDKRNTHGTDINYDPNKLTIDFSSNKKIVGLPSMEGSKYIWATPDFNFLHFRKLGGTTDPKVEESKREVFLMLDWWEAIGFGLNQLVYVYKPAA